MKTILSSPTKERLLEAINAFYYTTNCIITEDDKVVNTKLDKQLGTVTNKRNRWQFNWV